MKIVYFTHSLVSCWNHGNAHFLRGVMRELLTAGHDVRVVEPETGWSRQNLLAEEGGAAAVEDFARRFPMLDPRIIRLPAGDEAKLDQALDGAELVLMHEWNEPALVAAAGARRAAGANFLLLFHDTHHRMVSEAEAMARYDLSGYDGILAFGETLREAYLAQGWKQVFTWHEAADTALFHPPATEQARSGAVWIGNWGDGERSQELRDYMLEPVTENRVHLDIYGVRYPEAAKAELQRRGIAYHGWLPNARAPELFARHRFTLHVPRRFYVTHLPGIPTIRVFEALACGIPLLSAPWRDSENLFTPGKDFLQAADPQRMRAMMRDLQHDAELRASLARNGLETIQARHSCKHRAQELLAIASGLRSGNREAA